MRKRASLLFELYHQQFEEIHNEIECEEKGVKFHYVIDNDEIVKYIMGNISFNELPSEELFYEQNINYIADEQYALLNIFTNPEKKPVFLDEYLVEFHKFKSKLSSSIKDSASLQEKLNQYQSELETSGSLDATKGADFSTILKNNITLLISYSSGILASKVDRLIDVVKNRQLIIEDSDFYDGFVDKEIILQAFNENTGNTDIFKVTYDFFLSKIPKRLPHHVRELKKLAKYRDAQAIDRICNVNIFLEAAWNEKRLKSRHVFLYLSSTRLSNNLFYITKLLQPYYPRFDDYIINPLRINAQLFLKILCEQNSANKNLGISKKLENYWFLKNSIIQLTKGRISKLTIEERDRRSNEMKNILFSYFNYSRENVENYFVLSEFNSYKKIITNAAFILADEKNKKLLASNRFYIDMRDTLSYLIELGEKKERIYELKKRGLENLTMLVKFSDALATSFDNLKHTPNYIINIKTGKDCIKGRVHHLPLLFLNSNTNFRKITNTVSDKIIDYFPLLSSNFRDLINYSLTGSIENIEISLDEKLLRAFIFILLPNYGREENDKITFKWIKSIFDSEFQNNTSVNTTLDQDYRYFIIWVARRCANYPYSISLAQESIDKYPSDPRFHHGLALGYYCNYVISKKAAYIEIERLKLAISETDQSLLLYKELKYENIFLKEKIINSLLNTIAYLYVELYTMEQTSSNLINQARHYVDTLKKNELESYYQYPEYLHTESFLELNEFNLSWNAKVDFESKTERISKIIFRNKLECALEAINKAIKLVEQRNEIESLERYKLLRDKIIQTANNTWISNESD